MRRFFRVQLRGGLGLRDRASVRSRVWGLGGSPSSPLGSFKQVVSSVSVSICAVQAEDQIVGNFGSACCRDRGDKPTHCETPLAEH